jgi:hypothetical protein
VHLSQRQRRVDEVGVFVLLAELEAVRQASKSQAPSERASERASAALRTAALRAAAAEDRP